MFLVFVVQRIEGCDGQLSVTHVARFSFLLPKFISSAEVEEVIATDSSTWGHDAKGGKGRKGRINRIGCTTHVKQTRLATETIAPFSAESPAGFEPRGTTTYTAIG